MVRLVGAWAKVITLALVALVLTHDLIFLLGYGASFGDALTHTGHDHGWRAAVLAVLAMGTVLLAVATWRLRRLSGQVSLAHARQAAAEPDVPAFVQSWLRLSVGIACLTASLLVLQENVEHVALGAPPPGLGVLTSPVYPNAIAVIFAVALVVGLVAALIRWRLEVLSVRLRAAQPQHACQTVAAPRSPDWVARRTGSIIGRCLAGRAPPSLVPDPRATPRVIVAA